MFSLSFSFWFVLLKTFHSYNANAGSTAIHIDEKLRDTSTLLVNLKPKFVFIYHNYCKMTCRLLSISSNYCQICQHFRLIKSVGGGFLFFVPCVAFGAGVSAVIMCNCATACPLKERCSDVVPCVKLVTFVKQKL